jgi:hypothetical protein
VVLQTLSISIISKWFSRKQFPFVGAVFLTFQNMEYLLQKQLQHFDKDRVQWITMSISLVLAVLNLKYMVIEPIDSGLIINESARNLTSELNQQKQIISVYNF